MHSSSIGSNLFNVMAASRALQNVVSTKAGRQAQALIQLSCASPSPCSEKDSLLITLTTLHRRLGRVYSIALVKARTQGLGRLAHTWWVGGNKPLPCQAVLEDLKQGVRGRVASNGVIPCLFLSLSDQSHLGLGQGVPTHFFPTLSSVAVCTETWSKAVRNRVVLGQM